MFYYWKPAHLQNLAAVARDVICQYLSRLAFYLAAAAGQLLLPDTLRIFARPCADSASVHSRKKLRRWSVGSSAARKQLGVESVANEALPC